MVFNIFSFAGEMVSIPTTQHYPRSSKAAMKSEGANDDAGEKNSK